MRKISKFIVAATAVTMILGSSLGINAASNSANIKENEQKIIDELNSRGYDETNRYYNLVVEEFEYTPGDISDAAKENIKNKYNALTDPTKNGLTPTEYRDYARSIAQSLGGDMTIDISKYPDDIDNAFIYGRFEGSKLVYAKTINGLLKNAVVTFDSKDFPIDKNGKLGTKDSIVYSEDTYYLVDADGAVAYSKSGVYTYNGKKIIVEDGVWDGKTYVVDMSKTTVAAIGTQTYTGSAIKPTISVTYSGKKLTAGTDYTVTYSNNVKVGTASVKITGVKAFEGSVTKTFTIAAPAVNVKYRTHVQSYGWMADVSNGAVSGTVGQAKRLEAIEISVSGMSGLGIQYTTHCQSYGWLPWSANGDLSGTEGEGKRLEAIEIKLTGNNAKYYDVYYRVHAQSYGWMGWAKNGAPAGTAGYAKRLEGIEIVVVRKGEAAPTRTNTMTAAPYVTATGASTTVSGENSSNIAYKTQVQTYGWQGWKYNGAQSGTVGEAKRLEAINIKLTNQQYSGGITYRTHIQSIGWQDWKSNGALSGTVGQAKRLEAIEIKLTGEMEKQYDVYYRVQAQTYGWLGWAKNGQDAGTSGLAKRLETIEIVLVKKGQPAPGSTANAYISK